jgi:hypothetical protein
MKFLALTAAAIAALALSACIGFIVPIPTSASSAPDTDRSDRR